MIVREEALWLLECLTSRWVEGGGYVSIKKLLGAHSPGMGGGSVVAVPLLGVFVLLTGSVSRMNF